MPLTRRLPMLVALAAILALACPPAGAAPRIVAAPVVRGDAVVGGSLAARPAAIDGASPDDAWLTWERETPHGFVEIDGAHEATYVPEHADAGRRLRVHVVVETAEGIAEAWSSATDAVRPALPARLRIGAAVGAPVRLARWIAIAGDRVEVRGALPAAVAADARVRLVPTVPIAPARSFALDVAADGSVGGAVEPTANSMAWLEGVDRNGDPVRIRLGLIGVRPRIRLLLGARPDGRDAAGRALIRDLRILPGSAILPRRAGVRLTWEGRLPGDGAGTAVCRSDERVVSGRGGALRGECLTRGAWAAARWRLVADPGSTDPAAAAYLPATSSWVAARVAARW